MGEGQGEGEHFPTNHLQITCKSLANHLTVPYICTTIHVVNKHLVPDRRIRALIKSKDSERNQDQYVEGINGQDQSHRIHR